MRPSARLSPFADHGRRLPQRWAAEGITPRLSSERVEDGWRSDVLGAREQLGSWSEAREALALPWVHDGHSTCSGWCWRHITAPTGGLQGGISHGCKPWPGVSTLAAIVAAPGRREEGSSSAAHGVARRHRSSAHRPGSNKQQKFVRHGDSQTTPIDTEGCREDFVSFWEALHETISGENPVDLLPHSWKGYFSEVCGGSLRHL
jgi:hypothetical protein